MSVAADAASGTPSSAQRSQVDAVNCLKVINEACQKVIYCTTNANFKKQMLGKIQAKNMREFDDKMSERLVGLWSESHGQLIDKSRVKKSTFLNGASKDEGTSSDSENERCILDDLEGAVGTSQETSSSVSQSSVSFIEEFLSQ